MAVPQDGYWAVLVDDRLLSHERRSVLAHEIVHVERGGGAGYPGQPATWDAVVVRDEAATTREAARRMLPADELTRFLHAQVELGEAVTLEAVAEHFDVSLELAAAALADGRPPCWMS